MPLFHIVTQGVLFGLTLSLMVGPAFFSLLQTSISKGFRSGSHLALGISASDVLMVFVAWYGLSTFFENDKARDIVSVVGGIVIIIFGLYTATRRHVTPKARTKMVNNNGFLFKHLGQGFIFNIANPGTWLYWLIPIGVANQYNKSFEQIIFLVSILVTNLLMDLIKCAIANELKRFLTDNVITIINRIVGCILIVFGLYLAITVFIPEPPIINNLHQ